MSIYPVRLAKWFPFGDEMHETMTDVVSAMRCLACDSRCRWRRAWGHHSIPWGHGDIWCSEKCLNSDKIARIDKRRLRRHKRRWKDLGWIDVEAKQES